MRLRSSDAVTLGILAVVVVVLTSPLPRLLGSWVLHLGLLVGYAALLPLLASRPTLRELKNGARVRVNGTAGVVQVL